MKNPLSPVLMAYPGPPRQARLWRYVLIAAGIVGVVFYFRNSAQLAGLRPAYTPSIAGPEPLRENSRPSDSTQITDANEQTKAEEPLHIATAAALIPPTIDETTSEKHNPFPDPDPTKPAAPKVTLHPIDELIEKAEKDFDEVLKKESKDLKTAAAKYRERRGRHPPPGFDVWFDFAQKNGAVMVEDFWDQIYHDLGPFWGLDPKVLRAESWDYEMKISVRNQQATSGSDWFWSQIWLNMTQTIEDLLPDLDFPLNAMDEPRIAAPWEEVDRLMEIERKTRNMPPPSEVESSFETLPDATKAPEPDVSTRPKNFTETRPFWQVAARGCHPDSTARKAAMMSNFSNTPTISFKHATPHLYKGYVSNYSLSTDFCHQPDLQSLHGMMIGPLSVSETKVFAPLFGGSKLPTNNEILLPAPMYWNGEERFSGGGATGAPWHEKQNKVIWRGVATGGRNTAYNWKGFQRHRFVAMTNSTTVSGAESWTEVPENWALPSQQYHLAAQQEGRLGEWVKDWADTGFVDLMCSNGPQADGSLTCPYTDAHFSLAPGMKLADQFDRKYLPDIDGNSFSGRYRGFLMSTSLPIKATIFREWHDSRLAPWVHFVPMDNRFMDFWGIIEYFIGYKGKSTESSIEGHDAAAEKIATAGQEWANKVLRKEDMQIYVLRLLLEYARLGDARRHTMGWVDDLLS